eukprot:11574-Heterococcus_DN1.PRE.2
MPVQQCIDWCGVWLTSEHADDVREVCISSIGRDTGSKPLLTTSAYLRHYTAVMYRSVAA